MARPESLSVREQATQAGPGFVQGLGEGRSCGDSLDRHPFQHDGFSFQDSPFGGLSTANSTAEPLDCTARKVLARAKCAARLASKPSRRSALRVPAKWQGPSGHRINKPENDTPSQETYRGEMTSRYFTFFFWKFRHGRRARGYLQDVSLLIFSIRSSISLIPPRGLLGVSGIMCHVLCRCWLSRSGEGFWVQTPLVLGNSSNLLLYSLL